jgi:hypothetical protein
MLLKPAWFTDFMRDNFAVIRGIVVVVGVIRGNVAGVIGDFIAGVRRGVVAGVGICDFVARVIGRCDRAPGKQHERYSDKHSVRIHSFVL